MSRDFRVSPAHGLLCATLLALSACGGDAIDERGGGGAAGAPVAGMSGAGGMAGTGGMGGMSMPSSGAVTVGDRAIPDFDE